MLAGILINMKKLSCKLKGCKIKPRTQKYNGYCSTHAHLLHAPQNDRITAILPLKENEPPEIESVMLAEGLEMAKEHFESNNVVLSDENLEIRGDGIGELEFTVSSISLEGGIQETQKLKMCVNPETGEQVGYSLDANTDLSIPNLTVFYSLKDKVKTSIQASEKLSVSKWVLNHEDAEKFDVLTNDLIDLKNFFDEKSEEYEYFDDVGKGSYTDKLESINLELLRLFQPYLNCQDCEYTFSHTQEWCGNPKCRIA